MGSVQNATDDTFTELVLNSQKPVLVDFWGVNCGPCRMLAPVLDDLAQSQDALEIVKVEVGENAETARTYRVTSIPVLAVFVDGEMVKRIQGAKPRSLLVDELSDYLPQPG